MLLLEIGNNQKKKSAKDQLMNSNKRLEPVARQE